MRRTVANRHPGIQVARGEFSRLREKGTSQKKERERERERERETSGNQSILKEISPEYSLEGLMLKL